ncbi:MAG: TolC family protein [Alphaproteobacteria bacterium]|nr:TolC family protein [Alphaproteobacteria bacterium]
MRRWILVLAGLGLSTPALAGRPLGYEEALGLAVERNPTLRAARLTLDQTEADVTAANGQYDPVLRLDGGWNRTSSRQRFGQFPDPFQIDSDGWNLGMDLSGTAPTGTAVTVSGEFAQSLAQVRLDDTTGDPSLLDGIFGTDQERKSFQPSFRLTVSQELLKGIALGFNLQNVRRAVSGRTLAQLELDRAEQQALADVARAYWNWVYLDRLADIAHQSVDVAEENLRVISVKVDAGELAPVERTRGEAAAVQSRSNAIEAENNAAGARDGLLLLLGEHPGQDWEPASDPGQVPELAVDAGAAVDVALAQSLELQMQRQRVDDAARDLKVARHSVLPSLTANVSGGLSGFDDTSWSNAFVLYDTLLPSISVGGVFSVPLGSRASVGQVRRSSAELDKQKQALIDLEGSVRADVEKQVRVLTSAYQKVRLADINVRLAQETLDAERALVDVGRALVKDLLESQSQLDTAQGEAVRARTDYRLAEVELRRLQGQLARP